MPNKGERLRWPPRSRKRKGATRTSTSTGEKQPGLAQPNESDESASSQVVESDAASDVMKQAHADIERGLEDTDCRNSAAEILARNTAPADSR